MPQEYTVQFANPLEGADQYGNVTYSVKFLSEADNCLIRVQPKTVVQPGSKFYGRIEDRMSQAGKPYRVFKREQQQNYGQGLNAPQTASQRPTERNQDGARQGMSINNAANYVNLTEQGKEELTPEAWAAKVEKFARALYSIDLTQVKKEETVLDDIDESTPVDLSSIPDF